MALSRKLLTYYKCNGNLIKLNKLVSGYYEGQKLEDGTDVPKPKDKNKCSHGMCKFISNLKNFLF